MTAPPSTGTGKPDSNDIREYLLVTRELTRLGRRDPTWSAPLHLRLVAAHRARRDGLIEPAQFGALLHRLRQACAAHPDA